MTRSKFIATTPPVTVQIGGNTLEGGARALGEKGNMGWYLGGKIELPVGKETVWAQIGINITIPGSGAWKN